MKVISAEKIREAVAQLCQKANFVLRPDVLFALRRAYAKENNRLAKEALAAIIENARIARKKKIPLCQDTGLPCVFVELGDKVKVSGGLKLAINQGIELGYRKNYLRNSVIKDPFLRRRPGYHPAVIHIDIVKGGKLKITLMPKGFGCENRAQLAMFKPTAGVEEIKRFIVGAIRASGPDACPPYIVGVGIGGTADYACFLAKKALLKKVHSPQSTVHSLEGDLLREINRLNIGAMGFGGKATALAVNILMHPTHIAGMPVAINISCHALRSAEILL